MGGSGGLVNRSVERFFSWLGEHVAARPIAFIVGPLVLGALAILLAGFRVAIFHGLRIHSDMIYLYTPEDGISSKDRFLIDSIYPLNTSRNFEFGGLTDLGHLGVLIITAKNGGLVFSQRIFEEIEELESHILNLTVVWEDREYNWSSGLCAKVHDDGRCYKNPAHFIARRIKSIEEGSFQLPFPFYLDSRHGLVFFGRILGGVTLHEDGRHAKNCQAIMLLFPLDWMSAMGGRERAKLWEEEFIRFATNYEGVHINVAVFTGSTIDREFQRSILSMIPYIFPAFALMIFFCMASNNVDNAVHCKPWLGLTGCFTSVFSVVVSFALCIAVGIDFIFINIFIFFLMLGIGMDDTFMLLTAWRQTDPRKPVDKRMSESFSHVGVSITITSLTNLIAFMVGTISPFPAIYYFCIYISVAIIICYVYQITFFAGVMVYFGKLEKENRHGFYFWKTIEPNSKENQTMPFPFCPISTKDSNGSQISLFFREKLGGILVKTSVKITTLILFIVYIFFALYGMTLLKEDMNLKELVRKDSYAADSFDVIQKYFTNYQVRLQIVINKTMDYSDPTVQMEIEKMLHKFESLPNMADSSVTWSWLRAFQQFQNDNRTKSMLTGLDLSNKRDFIVALKDIFFRFPLGKIFKKDVIFNENYTDIIATRYFPFAYHLESSTDKKELFINVNEIKKTLPFDVAVFNPNFPFYELWSILKMKTLESIAMATIALLFTIFLFTPDLMSVLCVAFSMVSIVIGVMGYMVYLGNNLDSIVSLSLVLSVGLSVDYACHVAYAFASCPDTDPNQKLLNALHYTGYPILQSCLSTLAGVVIVFFLPSNTFLGAAKNIILLLIFASFHSLFLLPVLLSIVSRLFISKTKQKADIESLPKKTSCINVLSLPANPLEDIPKKNIDIKTKGYLNDGYVISEGPNAFVIKL